MSETRLEYIAPLVHREGKHEANFDVHTFGEYSVAEIVIQGSRKEQQDRNLIIPLHNDGFCSIICDGHGEQGGDIADTVSSQLRDYVQNTVVNTRGIDERLFQQYINDLDQAVQNRFSSAGTTLVCTFADSSGLVRIGTVGDSEVRVVDSNGKLKRITWPHNFSHKAEAMRLSGEEEPELTDHQKRLVSTDGRTALGVTRAIGDVLFPEALSQVEWKKYQMLDGDILVLASDGLWERLDGDTKRRRQFRDIFRTHHKSAAEAMSIFLKDCVTDGWTFYDNMSVHIITK
jgi:serine/threonine protein phosphatase PrpC